MVPDLNLAAILIYFFSYVAAVVLGHFAVCVILRKYPLQKKEGFEGAGAVIGALERIFTITFVLIGQYTAFALILTVKSIARFEELKNRKFAEYYLIGTLSSILFAMLVGMFASWLVRIL